MPQLSMLLKSETDVILGSSPSSCSTSHPSTNTVTDASKICALMSSFLIPIAATLVHLSLSTRLIFPLYSCHLSHLFSSLWPEWPFLNKILPHSILLLIDITCSLFEVLGGPIWPDFSPCPHHLMPLSLPASMLQRHQPPFKFFNHLVLFQIRATHLFFPLPKMASFPQPPSALPLQARCPRDLSAMMGIV